MKNFQFIFLASFLILSQANLFGRNYDPDSVYLFSYTTLKNNSHNGLHFAWSRDGAYWVGIGNEYGFVKSDYGRWGSEKKMFSPYLYFGRDGLWHCVWSLNDRDKTFAHAASADLVEWGRQSYPPIQAGANFLDPVIGFDPRDNKYSVSYRDKNQQYFQTQTTDFKTYSATISIEAGQYSNPGVSIQISGGTAFGQMHRVAWPLVENLIRVYEAKQYEAKLYSENPAQDDMRFAGLKPVTASILPMPQHAKPISDLLMGIFFEDINYAADGGLYAELVQNRGFEYAIGDKEGRDKNWNSTHSWQLKGENAQLVVDTANPVHPNNPHFAKLTVQAPGAVLTNAGFGGMAVKKGQAYSLSIFAKRISGNARRVQVSLMDSAGGIIAQTIVNASSTDWKKLKATLTPNADCPKAILGINPLDACSLGLDMVSLFPQNTFKGRANGLRDDLAKTIADIRPRFVRFPGGCVAHGDGLANIYKWKNTIGPLEGRKPMRNLWGYHQSMGLGYFEYFQFCEDIGAEPVPVLAAGVPCQNSGTGGAGQQGGIPMGEMDEYIQDVLDLVEYANGDVKTKWGKMRVEAGHPKPFNLKYIGIGNEDLITDIFEERFTMIYNAMKKAHPEITVIGTVGPFYEGTDYIQGWGLATKLKVPMVDEHYYEQPGWFIHNQHFYDSYDRNRSKVYLGEYASRGNTWYNALAEAAYLTAIERNADIVSMASYAPLLAKEGHTQWNPDLIYFNNQEVKPTVNYYIQKLFGQHAGDKYMPVNITLSVGQEAVAKRFSVSVVKDEKTNTLIVKLVNILPVPVTATLGLQGMGLLGGSAAQTLMQGQPEAKEVQPVESLFEITEKPVVEMPPYSFTVLRFGLQTK